MISIVTNKNTPWACLRHPDKNIFYWVHSKCASSYYKEIFYQMSWEFCTTKDISWQDSLVFSHIRDPLEKHRTGLIEYFYYHRCVDILQSNWDNDNFWSMLSRTPWLDVHSMSIWMHLEELADSIKWIPIDIDGENHVDLTLDLIHFDGDRSLYYQMSKRHASEGFKKQCRDRLLAIKPDPLIIKYLEKDRVIYDRVSRKPGFEPTNYRKQLEKLLAQDYDQAAAEFILDQQVSDGSYLKWQD